MMGVITVSTFTQGNVQLRVFGEVQHILKVWFGFCDVRMPEHRPLESWDFVM